MSKSTVAAKGNTRTKKSKRFYRYFMSYVILIVIMLTIVGSVVYKNFIDTLKKEAESANMAALKGVCNAVDTRLKEIDHLALSISSNRIIRQSSLMGNGYNNWQCLRELSKYKSSNQFVYDIVLYLPNRDNRVYSTFKSGDLDTLFNYMYRYETWTKEELLQIMEEEPAPIIRAVEPVMKARTDTVRLATYIYPLTINTIKPQGAIIFLIRDQSLSDITKTIWKGYEGYVVIADEQDRQISLHSLGMTKEKAININSQLGDGIAENETTYGDVNGQNYAICRVVSDYNGWSYTAIVSTDQLFAKANASRDIFMYTIVAILVIGLCIAFVFSSSHYKVLRRLADAIKGHERRLDLTDIAIRDEVTYITQAIEEVAYKNRGLNEQLRVSMDKARSQFLISLLKGNADINTVGQEMFDNFNIKLVWDYPTTILIFAIDNYKTVKINQANKKDEELLIFSIINVVEELATNIGYGYGVDLMEEGKVALILNLSPDVEDEYEINKLAKSAQSFFKKYYNISLTVGVGNIYRDAENIKAAFSDANRAASYRLIRGRGNIIFYQDIEESIDRGYAYPIEFDRQLTMAMRQCRYDEITEIVDKIKDYIYEQNMSPEIILYMYYGLINNIIKMSTELNIDIDSCIDRDVEKMLIESYETIEELMHAFESFCIKVSQVIDSCRHDKDNIIAKAIIEYIEVSYMDNTLNLDSIASYFGASVSYCSKVFKQYTGNSLMQYVDNYRMDRAKQLLIETDLPLKKLTEQVGYVDETNFIRKFKRNEGITPIQYRDIYRMSRYVDNNGIEMK